MAAAFNWLTNNVATSQSENPPDDTKKRRHRLEEAQRNLAKLKGIEESKDIVQSNLLDLIERARQQGKSGFGVRADGVVLILSGPKGVGKTTYAELLEPLLYGLGALYKDTLIRFSQSDLSAGQSTYQVALDKAHNALDGMLLVDDADWLLEKEAWGGSPGIEVGRTLSEVTKNYPHRLFMVLVLSASETANRLLNDEAHQNWLNSFYKVEAEFDYLSDEVLFNLLTEYLAEDGLQMPSDPKPTERALRSGIANLNRQMGEQFNNTHAMRGLCDKIKPLAGTGEVMPEHVREAVQTW
jgi:DNA polymerase III delta prime subunit